MGMCLTNRIVCPISSSRYWMTENFYTEMSTFLSNFGVFPLVMTTDMFAFFIFQNGFWSKFIFVMVIINRQQSQSFILKFRNNICKNQLRISQWYSLSKLILGRGMMVHAFISLNFSGLWKVFISCMFSVSYLIKISFRK